MLNLLNCSLLMLFSTTISFLFLTAHLSIEDVCVNLSDRGLSEDQRATHARQSAAGSLAFRAGRRREQFRFPHGIGFGFLGFATGRPYSTLLVIYISFIRFVYVYHRRSSSMEQNDESLKRLNATFPFFPLFFFFFLHHSLHTTLMIPDQNVTQNSTHTQDRVIASEI